MICPIVNAGRKEGEAATPCVESQCAWWIQGQHNTGGCAFRKMAHYLAALLETQRNIDGHLQELIGGLALLVGPARKGGGK